MSLARDNYSACWRTSTRYSLLERTTDSCITFSMRIDIERFHFLLFSSYKLHSELRSGVDDASVNFA